jgi:hypothetical protein
VRFSFHRKRRRSQFNSENRLTARHKLSPCIQDHENSPIHRSAFQAWKELERGLNKCGQIDDHFQQQNAKSDRKRREYLERVTPTIQNLAQRRHRESVVGDSNPGNFLALFNYLAKFDPVARGFGLSFWKTWMFVIIFSGQSK